MAKRISIISLCFILLLSCTSSTKEEEINEIRDTFSTEISKKEDKFSVNKYSYLKFEGDSVAIVPFEIEVELSQKAKDKIVKGNETIIINAYLTGIPKDSSLFVEDGQFYVASVEKEVAYGKTAKFDNIKFSRKTFEQLVNKNVYLHAYAYSGRKSSPDNLLNCSMISDSISNVVNKKFTISCKLIKGDE